MTPTDQHAKRDDVAGTIRPEDAAHHIQSISVELSTMARRSGLDFVGYLLDIVREEGAARRKLT